MIVRTSKILIFSIVLLCSIINIMAGCTDIEEERNLNTNENEDLLVSVTDDESLGIEYVDNKIKLITESAEYKSADIVERKQVIEQLLTQLKRDKKIKNFSYNKKSFLFSFEYPDGSLGGVMIKDFDTQFDALPNTRGNGKDDHR